MNSVYNPTALEANRLGRLTLSQSLWLMPWILIALLFCFMGFWPIADITTSLLSHTFKGDMIGIVFGYAFGVAFLALAVWIGGRALLDLLTFSVLHVDGPASKDILPGQNSGRVLYYSVGPESFQIPWAGTWQRLPAGHTVRAYYTPRTRTLVNVEPQGSHHSAGG